MEHLKDYVCEVHRELLNFESDISDSAYQDIKIKFYDGSIKYNKLLLSFLEPVIVGALKDINCDCDDICVIYSEKSFESMKHLPMQLTEEIVSIPIFSYLSPAPVDDEEGVKSNINCNICNKEFFTKKQLRRHYYYKHYKSDAINLHGGHASSSSSGQDVELSVPKKKEERKAALCEVRSLCSECGKSFKLLKDLRRHKETVHNQDIRTRYYCNFCNASFNRKDNLLKHVSKLHP